MGNGMPLAAVVCRRHVAQAFASGPEYFNTFGGNPVRAVLLHPTVARLPEPNPRQRGAACLRRRARHATGSFFTRGR